MRKVINQLLTIFLGSEYEFSFEERLVLACILYGCVICFISIFGNLGLKLDIGTIIIVLISFIAYLISYLISRLYKKVNASKWFLTIYTLIFCNFYWFTNYGSRGSAMYIFPVYYFPMIFIWSTLQILVISVIVIINICCLFIIELIYPNLIPLYPNEWSRVVDSYSSLIMFIGIFSIVVVATKNNYLKQSKLAQKSDKLKSAFLANMSYEIRTPLNAIVGFSKLMTKRELTKEKKENYANLINDNSNYLMQLVSDILDISQIESGQLKINLQNVNVNELLERLFQNFKHLLAQSVKKEVKLLTDIPVDTFIMEVDGTRLEQIVSNLINNAIKFTNEGYIKFGYFLEGNNVIFYVEDTGIGIKEEFQPEIFNRFVKNEEDTELKFIRGTGIGLSLSKDLVEMLGGNIWFNSRYHEGSIFYFSLHHKELL